MESTTVYIFAPCVRSFTSPGIDTREMGPTAYIIEHFLSHPKDTGNAG